MKTLPLLQQFPLSKSPKVKMFEDQQIIKENANELEKSEFQDVLQKLNSSLLLYALAVILFAANQSFHISNEIAIVWVGILILSRVLIGQVYNHVDKLLKDFNEQNLRKVRIIMRGVALFVGCGWVSGVFVFFPPTEQIDPYFFVILLISLTFVRAVYSLVILPRLDLFLWFSAPFPITVLFYLLSLNTRSGYTLSLSMLLYEFSLVFFVRKIQKIYYDQSNLKRENENLVKSLQNSQTKLNEMVEVLQEQSQSDPLTGLSNRRHFMEKILQMQKNKDRKLNYSLLILDLDFFKSINDRYGHLMGDTVLKKTAQILKDKTRSGDCAARFGGEEFIILLPNIRLKPASQIAERIRLAMEEELFVTDNGESFHVTMSVGVTESTSTEDVRKVVQRADKLLYQAKQKGRNCICHSDNFRDSQMNFNSFYNSEANFKIHMSC